MKHVLRDLSISIWHTSQPDVLTDDQAPTVMWVGKTMPAIAWPPNRNGGDITIVWQEIQEKITLGQVSYVEFSLCHTNVRHFSVMKGNGSISFWVWEESIYPMDLARIQCGVSFRQNDSFEAYLSNPPRASQRIIDLEEGRAADAASRLSSRRNRESKTSRRTRIMPLAQTSGRGQDRNVFQNCRDATYWEAELMLKRLLQSFPPLFCRSLPWLRRANLDTEAPQST